MAEEPVHLKHFKDGFPLCWEMRQSGSFTGTFHEEEVTCKDCLRYLRE